MDNQATLKKNSCMRVIPSIFVFVSIGTFSLGCSHLTEPSLMQSEMHEMTYPKGSGCEDENGRLPPTTIYGDFDGDKKQDRASLIQKSPEQGALMVWLASRKEPLELDVTDSLGYVAISVANAGELIESACKRGYADLCEEAEQKEIKLSTDGIWYALCESAASVFYWDAQTSRFSRLWYSD